MVSEIRLITCLHIFLNTSPSKVSDITNKLVLTLKNTNLFDKLFIDVCLKKLCDGRIESSGVAEWQINSIFYEYLESNNTQCYALIA